MCAVLRAFDEKTLAFLVPIEDDTLDFERVANDNARFGFLTVVEHFNEVHVCIFVREVSDLVSHASDVFGCQRRHEMCGMTSEIFDVDRFDALIPPEQQKDGTFRGLLVLNQSIRHSIDRVETFRVCCSCAGWTFFPHLVFGSASADSSATHCSQFLISRFLHSKSPSGRFGT